MMQISSLGAEAGLPVLVLADFAFLSPPVEPEF
jgi:hypothetical protein